MLWQVKAMSRGSGAVMMFGLEAVDREQALVTAIDRIPFPASSENVEVTKIHPRGERTRPVTQMRRIPVNMSQDDLIGVLEDILKRVRSGDSFEGSLVYAVPADESADPLSFDVLASYRTGNLEGHGGMQMIGEWYMEGGKS